MNKKGGNNDMSNENIVPKPDFESRSHGLIGYKDDQVDQCYSVSFMKKDANFTDLLQLKITLTAVVSQGSKLHPDTIHKWLFLNGIRFAEKVDEFKTLIITSKDVIDGKLITDWTQLQQGQ